MITLKQKPKPKRPKKFIKFGIRKTQKHTVWSANTIGIKSKTIIRIDFLIGISRYYFRKFNKYVWIAHLGRYEVYLYFNRKGKK